MANTIAYADIFQSELQKLYLQGAMTAWMENNAAGIDYRGGKYIYMPSLVTDGLGDYSRTLGFPSGAIVTANVPYELTKDRGRQFMIDAVDVDESHFVATAVNVMSTFQREHVIPEIDAYRIAKLYADVHTGAHANVNETGFTKANVLATLEADIASIQDVTGEIPLVIMISGTVSALLGNVFQRTLDVINFQRGAFYTRVRSLNSNPLMVMPSARFKKTITFLDGVTAGQEAGGFTNTGDINWIITPANAPVAIAKVDKPRIFSPDVNQNADAWLVDYRLYHDLWIMPKGYNATIINTATIT